MSKLKVDTDLDQRAGLPDEWLFLLRQYPRESWSEPGKLSPLAAFWLDRHDGFRHLGAQLDQSLSQFREGEIDADRFGGFFGPGLQQFLTGLHHHHQIEDYHYFPAFAAAEQRLVHGFELLEADHELIHHRIEQAVGSANALFAKMQEGDKDAILRAADTYADTSGLLISGLMRHLDDEEDLIIPLITDRGDDAFEG